MTTEQQYIASLDIEASYNLAKQMEAYRTNPVLGYRPAGSKAEFETGEMLKSYMEDLGLSNVRKDEIKVDGWEFEKAVLAYADAAGERQEVQLGAYQTDFVTKGAETFQVVYVGKGGEKDYADKDVTGKSADRCSDRRIWTGRREGFECPGYSGTSGGSSFFYVL